MEKMLLISLVVLALLISGCSQLGTEGAGSGGTQPPANMPNGSNAQQNQSSGSGSGAGTQSNAPETAEVSIKNFAFSPAEVTIRRGGTVNWVNDDSVEHSVISDYPGFKSGTLSVGGTYRFSFGQAGTYEYHCGAYPAMTGKVIVE